MLGAYRGPICCHGCVTYIDSKLGSLLGFGFMEFKKYNILMI